MPTRPITIKSEPAASVAFSPAEIQGLSLRRNFSWTLASSVVSAGCQGGMLVVLAKLGTPEMVGQFSLGYAIGAPLIVFTGLHLRSLQATDAVGEYLFGHYLGLRILTSFVALALIWTAALLTGYSRETKLVVMAIGVAKVIESWQDIIYGLLQQRERMDRMAISIICRVLLELAALTLGLLLTGQLLPAILGLMVVRLLVLTAYDWRSVTLVSIPQLTGSCRHPNEDSWWGAMQPHWDLTKFGRLAWLALPLGIALTLASLNTNIPRLFIGRAMGEHDLGIFAALAYIMVGGNMVVMALGLSLSPRLSKYFAANQRSAFRKLLLKGSLIVTALGLSGVIIIHLAGRKILTIIYRPEYAEHVDVFLWLMVGAAIACLANFLRQSMIAARFIRIQLPLYALATFILSITCYYLVPLYGLLGAAWASLISALVILLGNGSVICYILMKHAGNLGDIEN